MEGGGAAVGGADEDEDCACVCARRALRAATALSILR